MATSPFEIGPTGLIVRLKVTPKARRNAVLGLAEDTGGRTCLKISLAAVPEGGKANRALIEFLAGEWGVAKSAISVVMGATSRRKVVEIRGSAAALLQLLSPWFAKLSQ